MIFPLWPCSSSHAAHSWGRTLSGILTADRTRHGAMVTTIQKISTIHWLQEMWLYFSICVAHSTVTQRLVSPPVVTCRKVFIQLAYPGLILRLYLSNLHCITDKLFDPFMVASTVSGVSRDYILPSVMTSSRQEKHPNLCNKMRVGHKMAP